jgi:hypothetical protein
MDFLRFEYVYSVFNIGSLFRLIDGILFPCSRRAVLKSEDYPGANEEAKEFTLFNENTDFDNYDKLDHLCLVDANNLTNKQIEQLRRLSTKGVHITILSNKMDGTEETKTFKKLNKFKENEIVKKRVSYICPRGTYDVEITKEENENSKIYEINGVKWYTQCNINCFDDVNLTKEEENSDEYKNFELYLIKNK